MGEAQKPPEAIYLLLGLPKEPTMIEGKFMREHPWISNYCGKSVMEYSCICKGLMFNIDRLDK